MVKIIVDVENRNWKLDKKKRWREIWDIRDKEFEEIGVELGYEKQSSDYWIGWSHLEGITAVDEAG